MINQKPLKRDPIMKKNGKNPLLFYSIIDQETKKKNQIMTINQRKKIKIPLIACCC